MYKLAGVLLLLLGSFGFSFSICREREKRLKLLKEILRLYQLLQSEISYTALPLPQIFRIAAEKTEAPFLQALLDISRDMESGLGEAFEDIWERRLIPVLERLPLKQGQQKLLLDFPKCLGSHDCQGQAKAMEMYMEELSREIARQTEENKNQNKVIISLGVAAGLFTIIILL